MNVDINNLMLLYDVIQLILGNKTCSLVLTPKPGFLIDVSCMNVCEGTGVGYSDGVCECNGACKK